MTDATMSREEIAAFLAALKKLRDGLDAFNGSLADIDGAGMRLGLLSLPAIITLTKVELDVE